MPNLKDLKNRINSVKSTRKITSAMKMVAAAKLRRAQESAEAARPYAARMDAVLANLARAAKGSQSAPMLLRGTGSEQTHLLIVATAERGLCGGFNSSIVKMAKLAATKLLAETEDRRATSLELAMPPTPPQPHSNSPLEPPPWNPDSSFLKGLK